VQLDGMGCGWTINNIIGFRWFRLFLDQRSWTWGSRSLSMWLTMNVYFFEHFDFFWFSFCFIKYFTSWQSGTKQELSSIKCCSRVWWTLATWSFGLSHGYTYLFLFVTDLVNINFNHNSNLINKYMKTCDTVCFKIKLWK
jgi:hypothetical protein